MLDWTLNQNYEDFDHLNFIYIKILINRYYLFIMKKKLFTISDFPFYLPNRKNKVLVGVRPFRKGGIRLEK